MSSQGKIAGLKTLGHGFFRARSAPPVARPEQKTTFKGDRASDSEGDTKESPILMPQPISSAVGCNLPSIILEQHSSISSTETRASRTLVSGDASFVAGVNRPAVRTPTAAKPMPEMPILSCVSKPFTPHHPSSVPPSFTAVPTLEAILLDRKRRLAAHAVMPGSTSNMANTPEAYPPISYKDFAFASNSPTKPSPSNSVASPPSSLRGGVVGTVGKGTKFKSSPIGGGNGNGDVAERL